MSRFKFSQNLLIAIMLVMMLAFPVFTATTGKISGKIVDKTSGESLPGVNVVVEGTKMGGATDAEGDYFILNVPPGTYSLQAIMMGYQKVTQTNIKVMVDRTTTVNFQLETTIIAGQEITVVSERPIIEKDVTGTMEVLDTGFIERAPVIDLKDALRQQTGIYYTGETTYMRAGLASEVNYRLDGTSLNSGLLSDNWSRLNTTAMQEISVQTGGYNAEYGEAMSGVVNVVTKEASSEKSNLHGTVKYRMKPAGQYHWGKNMYDNNLWKYSHYDKAFWEAELQDVTKRTGFAQYYQRFYEWDGNRVPTAEELLSTYRQQITPNPILGDYTKRPEHDIEATLYGSFMKNLNFLLTGRYKNGVNIFPQAEEYNPEYNLQGKFNYNISQDKKLTLSLLRGWYKSDTYTESNWNNMESSQEARWQPNADVRSPYDNKAYAPWGGYWLKGPEEKAVNMGSLKWQHTLSPATFYTVQLTYLVDDMTELQDYTRWKTTEEQVRWGDSWFDLGGNFRLESRQIQVNNYSTSKVFSAKADMTSQMHKNHQVKSGAEFKFFDVNYEHYYMEFPAGDVWHLDNVFDGKPVEGALYVQDKMEFQGLILNLGLRMDAFNAQHNYAENLFDPLGFEVNNGGDGVNPSNTAPIWQSYMAKKDWFAVIPGVTTDYFKAFAGKKQDKMTVESEWKVALAPRVGVSFPITDNSKLRFSYGHFYQRPSWAKIMGFPTSWYESNPLSSVRMDQWQGWYGQPGLTYEKTVQYELGYDQNIFDIFRFDVAAYYKDASNLTRFAHYGTYNVSGGGFSEIGWSSASVMTNAWARNLANDGHDNIFYTNNAYKDIRGVEVTMDKLFNGRWAANLTFNYGLSTGGAAGYWFYTEDSSMPNLPHSFSERKTTWISNYVVKGSVNYVTPSQLGPAGVLSDISLGLYYEYFAGPQYTWYPKDFTGLKEPNNKRWYPHQRTDFKFNKRIPLGRFTPVIGLEIFNVFNNYDRVLLYGTDLDNWEMKKQMPQISQSKEDDVWYFYNSISNPRRMFYLTLSLEF